MSFLSNRIILKIIPLNRNQNVTILWNFLDSLATKMLCFHYNATTWQWCKTQAIEDLKSKLHTLWACLLSQNLSKIDSSTSLHNGQTQSIKMSILAFHMFIVIDLIQLTQMTCGSFLLLYLCQMFIHLSLKLSTTSTPRQQSTS
jgi:dimeric dUTPase (all-alpha-NTP-PPase superfamily)